MLLFGALEEAHTITADMVDATAAELNRDLGAGLAMPAVRLATDPRDELLRRIEVLESQASRQALTIRRMMDLLNANVTGQ